MRNGIVNWQTFQYPGFPNRITEPPQEEPSMTVPGQTLSLADLLSRYVRGENVQTFTPVYNGDNDDLPDVTRMDEMDRRDLARNIKQNAEELRDDLISRRERRELEKKEKREAALKSLDTTTPDLSTPTGADGPLL